MRALPPGFPYQLDLGLHRPGAKHPRALWLGIRRRPSKRLDASIEVVVRRFSRRLFHGRLQLPIGKLAVIHAWRAHPLEFRQRRRIRALAHGKGFGRQLERVKGDPPQRADPRPRRTGTHRDSPARPKAFAKKLPQHRHAIRVLTFGRGGVLPPLVSLGACCRACRAIRQEFWRRVPLPFRIAAGRLCCLRHLAGDSGQDLRDCVLYRLHW